jgi:hypothetical protein
MKSGSIMTWFIPCKIKVPGIYGFQISGAGICAPKVSCRVNASSDVVAAGADEDVDPDVEPDDAAGAWAAGAAQAANTVAKRATADSIFVSFD